MTQPRNTVISSVSFDPEVFNAMEDRINKLHMNRSEYLNRLVRADAKRKGPLLVHEYDEVQEEPAREPKYPVGLLPNVDTPDASRARRSKKK